MTAYWQWYAYHLDVLSVVLPIYILCTLPIIQLTHLILNILICGDRTKGRFCELKSGLFSLRLRLAWRTLITNLQLPETFEGEWVPIGFETQLSPFWEFGRGARDTFMELKNINQEEIWGFATDPVNNLNDWYILWPDARVWDPARREWDFYSIWREAGRRSKSSSHSKLPVWFTWTWLHPCNHLNGWLPV